MPYVKITGLIDVPDEHVGDDGRVTDDGYQEIMLVAVGDLDDLNIALDDDKKGG